MIPKITANGYALLLNALDGVGIQFSKIVVGNGEKPADYRVLSDLQNPILSAKITEITRMEKYAILRAPMLNSDVEGRLHWTELGVFTKNPSGGEDILYGYAHTDLSGDGQGISVPSYDTNMIELAHIIYVYVGEVDDVTAIIAESSEYASATALKNHETNETNPHRVSAQQVGLGNVPNVTPENQKPVFSETVTSVTTADDGTKSLPNILNGDIMGVILQKIRSAISAFISHLNATNPHGLGASDVGAASDTHYHSATDINKGTLSLLRGGTGGSTAQAARINLGVAEAVESTSLISNKGIHGCYYRTVDGDTEWINPPMISGVEYRTTERFEGRPVYVKMKTYTIGSPDTAGITTTISAKDIYKLISYSFAYNDNGILKDYSEHPGNVIIDPSITDGELTFHVTFDMGSLTEETYTWIKYTKV